MLPCLQTHLTHCVDLSFCYIFYKNNSSGKDHYVVERLAISMLMRGLKAKAHIMGVTYQKSFSHLLLLLFI